MAESARCQSSAKGESACLRRRARSSCLPSTKCSTSPTVIDSARFASMYPPSAPRRDSTKPPCFRLARISSRNFCGIFWRLAIAAILTGSPGGCEARSKTAWRAYSLLTEMFIETRTGRALPFRTSDNGIVKTMDVEKTIESLLNNQAKHDERLTRLETVVSSLAGSVGSLVGSVDKLADNIERLDEAMVTLAESGVQTNRCIDQLGMRVDQLVGAMGTMMQRQAPPPNVG